MVSLSKVFCDLLGRMFAPGVEALAVISLVTALEGAQAVRQRPAFIALLVATVLIIIALFYFLDFRALNPFLSRREHEGIPNSCNILVLGLDAGGRLSDVILVVSIDRPGNQAHFLSIPRDTRVEVEGRGFRKANSAYAYGSADLAVDTFEDLLGITMDGYLVIDFTGFIDLIDAIGGIPIDVEEPMKYTDVAGGLFIDIDPGYQVLDGKTAIDYVRYRESRFGDLGRIQRQHNFIWAAIKRLIAKPDKIPVAINLIKQSLHSDVHFDVALPVAVDFIQSLVLDRQDFMTLPGRPEYIDGVSYYIADPEAIANLDFLFTD